VRTVIQKLTAFFDFPQYKNISERTRAKHIALTQITALVVIMAFAVLVPEWETTPGSGERVVALQAALTNPVPLLILGSLWGLTPLTLVLLQRQRLLWAGVSTLVSILLSSMGTVLLNPASAYNNLMYAMAAVTVVLLSFLLINQAGGIITAGLTMMAFIADPGAAPPEQILGGILTLAATIVVGILYLRYFGAAQREGLRVGSEERVTFTEVIRGLTRLTSERRPLQEVLADGLRLIQNAYPRFEALGVYRVDDAGLYADLVQSVGVVRTSSQGRFTVGDVSPVGQAALSGQTQIRVESREGAAEAASLLPGMRQQVALPLHLGDRVIGVLDLQSRSVDALPAEDAEALAAVADALAIVVNSVQQLSAAQQRIDENTRLAEQARNALAEVQRLNKRLIGRAWSDYLKENSGLVEMEYDGAADALRSDGGGTSSPQLDAAIQQDKPQVAEGVVAFPLRARGQVIGAIELELPPNTVVSGAQVELLDELGERFGLAMENVRLLEQSQRSAQREALINVLGARIQTATNVEAILAETARSLSELLPTGHVSIRLGTLDQAQPVASLEERT